MRSSKNILHADDIQSLSKEIQMIIENFLNEKQSVCLTIGINPNNLECQVGHEVTLTVGTCKCQSEWSENGCSERDEPTKLRRESVCPIPLPVVNIPSDKPRWSQKPIVVAGGAGAGSALNQLHHPNGISLAEEGAIYVADYSNKRIVRWRMNGNQIGELVAGADAQASSPLSLTFPRRTFVTKDGSLYVLDDNTVLKLPKNATNYTVISKTLGVATSLFVDENYNVYVSERSNSRVLKWTPDMPPESEGIVVAGTGIKGSMADQLSWPRAVFVDNCENLYVIDRDNTRIQCWPKGALHGITVVAHSNARMLLGIKVDRSGNIYAVDWKKSQIVKYSPDGAEEVVVSDDGTHEVLNSPTDIEFDRWGNMFVNDKYNHRVLMFALESGTFGC